MAEVTVVGGGVVGLTSALELARAGHEVRCVRDQPVAETVSAVAGGLWFHYHVEPRDRVVAWGAVALARFADLSGDPASGVVMSEGLLVERGPADRWWTQSVPSWRDASGAELPEGATGGVVATVPLVTMPVFLPWLEMQCRDAGVAFEQAHVSTLDGLEGDVVVVAAGLRSGALVDDDAGMPSRGQVALLENPGLTRWLVPVAPEVSLTASDIGGRVVVTNHGHGGAGVTLSGGCAKEVVRLVGEAAGLSRP